MQNGSFRLTVPLRDGSDFLPLARAVLDAVGEGAPLPAAADFTAPFRAKHGDGDAAGVWVEHTKPDADPYAGGPIDVRTIAVERPDGFSLRVTIQEVIWVGDELFARAHGPAARVAAVAAVVRDFAARWER